MTMVVAQGVPQAGGARGRSGEWSVSGRRPAVARPAVGGGALRLTARGRVVVAVLALLLVGFGGAVVAAGADASAPHQGVQVVQHTVTSGETLWVIARPLVRPGEDVRDVVAEIESLNGLESGALRAGQVLWLPAARAPGR